MIRILFSLVFVEMGLVLALVFGTPIRKLLIMGLNLAKRGRGPLVAKTVAGTLLVVFISSLYSVTDIKKRSMDAGSINPTDQILLANHMLEASLMGFSLFLGLVIDRLHYYIKELHRLRHSLEEAVKQQQLGHVKGDNESELVDEETKDKVERGRTPLPSQQKGEIKKTS